MTGLKWHPSERNEASGGFLWGKMLRYRLMFDAGLKHIAACGRGSRAWWRSQTSPERKPKPESSAVYSSSSLLSFQCLSGLSQCCRSWFPPHTRRTDNDRHVSERRFACNRLALGFEVLCISRPGWCTIGNRSGIEKRNCQERVCVHFCKLVIIDGVDPPLPFRFDSPLW